MGKTTRERARASSRKHYARNREKVISHAAARTRTVRNKLREIARQYKETHPCIDCGETDWVVLDFDHRERELKTQTISYIARSSGSVERLQKEMSKCDVRCANCHRRRTARQFNWQ